MLTRGTSSLLPSGAICSSRWKYAVESCTETHKHSMRRDAASNSPAAHSAFAPPAGNVNDHCVVLQHASVWGKQQRLLNPFIISRWQLAALNCLLQSCWWTTETTPNFFPKKVLTKAGRNDTNMCITVWKRLQRQTEMAFLYSRTKYCWRWGEIL